MPEYTPLPEGLITMDELGIMSESGEIAETDNRFKLADTIIRATGVVIRYAAKQPDWTPTTVPYEARVIALDLARRVFNNPQNQQRIQTGPLGESYSSDELTGLALKESEEEILDTFTPDVEGDLGGLGIISVSRPDAMLDPFDNRLYVPVVGMGRNGDMSTSIPSLAKYLGVTDGL